MDTITVVTICYNCKDALERTIKSVIAQTYTHLEYIIVDGGSTDGTLDVIQHYHEHINQYISEPDEGIYDALNKGIRLGSGEWIVCMNAGDIFADDDTLKCVMSEPRSIDIKFLYSDYYELDKKGRKKLNRVNRSRGIVFHQSCIYKKALHEEYGYYLVTKPYMVSDLLFFLSVPERHYMKVHTPISINEYAGVSRQSLWCPEEALGLRIGFGIERLPLAFLKYCKLLLFRLFRR